MRRNNLFAKFIITFTLAAFLTISVGKVQRTYALATTAAITGAALLGAGAVYIAYLTLTGAEVRLPSTNIDDWLADIGQTAVSYGTDVGLYSQIYSYVSKHGVSSLSDFVVTLTSDDLTYMYNVFKDKALIKDIMSFSEQLTIVRPGLPSSYFSGATQYAIPFDHISSGLGYTNLTTLESQGYSLAQNSGSRALFMTSDSNGLPAFYCLNLYDVQGVYRNYMYSNGGTIMYQAQKLFGDTWGNINSTLDISYRLYDSNGVFYRYLNPFTYNSLQLSTTISMGADYRSVYPIFPDLDIYNSLTGEVIHADDPVSVDVVDSPDWPADTSSDDDFKPPVVPYVQLPDGGNWGFNLGDLLTELVNRSAQTITAVGIGDLINRFMNSLGSSTGDYIYYSDNDNNYYNYYSNTFYNPVTNNTNYNIDISDQGDVIPVDLNTIEQFTDNQYLDVVKERVNAFSDTVGSFVAFWHNVDYEIVYAVFGSALIVLLGAFIGKWGHS